MISERNIVTIKDSLKKINFSFLFVFIREAAIYQGLNGKPRYVAAKIRINSRVD